MAVQKVRKSRSKRNMRRAHDAIGKPAVSIDSLGNVHRRHHMSEDGTYRGRQIVKQKEEIEETEEETNS